MFGRMLTTATLLCLALAAAPAAEARPFARAELAACTHGSAATDRAAEFEARMRRARGAARMQMRFALQARTPDRPRWGGVSAPGFGVWTSADSGTVAYVYTKRIENLLAPASYRTVVRFRWLAANGHTLAARRLVSPVCRQPDPRPNLAVSEIVVLPGAVPGRARYLVTVRNTGRAAIGPYGLTLTIAGDRRPAVGDPGLGPHAATTFEVRGPACAPGAPLVAEVEPDEAVEERTVSDNRLSLPCPAA